MKQKFFMVLLLAAASLAGCATMVTTSGNIVIGDKNVSVGIVFTDRDHRLIRRYYESHHSRYKKRRVPPGLAKRGGKLPHGLAKRDRLPPGLRLRGLPEDLESTLSPLSKRYVRVVVGSDVVIMDRNTRVVFDIYRAVVSN
ncbi:MAG: hypothetical protein V3R65_09175 [Acidiferrobacterales bacterium]